MSERTPVGRWAPAVVWAVLIFCFSTGNFSGENTGHFLVPLLHWLLPGASEGQIHALHAVIRKLAHITEYFILGVLYFRALEPGRTVQRAQTLALAFAAFYAMSDELHQMFVPARGAALTDVAIDTFGAALAQVWMGLRRRVPQRTPVTP